MARLQGLKSREFLHQRIIRQGEAGASPCFYLWYVESAFAKMACGHIGRSYAVRGFVTDGFCLSSSWGKPATERWETGHERTGSCVCRVTLSNMLIFSVETYKMKLKLYVFSECMGRQVLLLADN